MTFANLTGLVINGRPIITLEGATITLFLALAALIWTVTQEMRHQHQIKKINFIAKSTMNELQLKELEAHIRPKKAGGK